jgi:hypothetical protein
MEALNLMARGCWEHDKNITFLRNQSKPERPRPELHNVAFERDV